MKEIETNTKLDPNNLFRTINEFPSLLKSQREELYGFEIKPCCRKLTGYYLKETELIGGNHQKVCSEDRKFPVLSKTTLTKWLCFYEYRNYREADIFYKSLQKASIIYGLNIYEPEWVEMPNNSSSKDLIDTVEDYIKKDTNIYSFVVFLLKECSLYRELKIHSFKNNYISQVVKVSKFNYKKPILSILLLSKNY